MVRSSHIKKAISMLGGTLATSHEQLLLFLNLIGIATLATLVTDLVQEGPGSGGSCEGTLLMLAGKQHLNRVHEPGEHEISESKSCLLVGSERNLAAGEENLNKNFSEKQDEKWATEGIKSEIEKPNPAHLKFTISKQKVKSTRKGKKKKQGKIESSAACDQKSGRLPDRHLPEAPDKVLDRGKKGIAEVQQAFIEHSKDHKTEVAAEVSKVFILTEEDLESRMRNFYASRIKAAFDPRETDQDGEIFPKVIKPLWAHAIHTPECSRLLEKSIQNVRMEANKRGLDTSSWYKESLRNILEILEPHLQTTNHQNHLSLPEMDDTMYRNLQVLWNSNPEAFLQIEPILASRLSKYELHRRLSTLTNQIIQKTAIENWKLISKALGDKGNKRRVNQFLKSLQQNFELDHEFPDTLNCFELWSKIPTIFTNILGKTKYDASSLLMSIVGPFEYRRRFNFEIFYHESSDLQLNIKPQTELPLNVMEDLHFSEKYKGVNVWNVCCIVRYLGLGNSKRFEDSSDHDLSSDFESVLKLLNCKTYWYVPWFESADRAWLTKTYSEYQQRLKDLCVEHRKRFIKSIKRQKEKGGEIEKKFLNFYREDQVLFYDLAMPPHVLKSLEELRAVNTKFKGISTLTDWESVFESSPWKFNSLQQEFIQTWFDQN
ncbi:hypothetical protein PGT21_034102 [Puccinia graminis f. sp. tritici]|uniref:Uncharacterized protein n=1 Tax=Puccinia graminis f. sp. tritici TaxID=56615 RepID=A0A5B0N138_PUCGR|nr:hypothetical protein PGT21_034102 [Puccinia graminis f. sp. tritici]KAA1081809.1 hypothetical protein PGTUg99_011765 [Puccinia graminis f. sp. tritici]